MSKIRRDLGQLSALSANISGTDEHID